MTSRHLSSRTSKNCQNLIDFMNEGVKKAQDQKNSLDITFDQTPQVDKFLAV